MLVTEQTRLVVMPDDPSGAMLAAPTFAVVGVFREGDEPQVCDTIGGGNPASAQSGAQRLTERYGWAAASVERVVEA